jgi:putative ABC transport system permease protein
MGFGVPVVGSMLMIVGLAMVTPCALWLVERLFHQPIAGALTLDGRLLRQQLTSNLWSAVGTTIALSVGLTLYVSALVWGFSMLVPFTPTDALPRLQVAILPAGLPDAALPEFLAIDGIQPGRCLPIATEQPRLSAATLAKPGFAHVDAQQQHVLVMGVDPQRAFDGSDPMFRLTFENGDAASAAKAMAEGHGCVIPDHFANQCNLQLGDTFSVDVPEQQGKEVTYTIVGIASIPGWNWLTKFSEVRRRAGRALAIVFTDYAQVRRDYGLERISFFWLDPAGNPADPDLVASLAQRIEPIGRKHSKVNLNVPRAGRTEVGTQYVNITDREEVKTRIAKRAGDVINGFKAMPLVTLAITSLALFNTIFASIRSRSWQFGILRGIGMTRGQLVRLIIGESLLLCLTACLLSVAAGTALAWCGTRLSALFFFFAGRTPPLAMPPLADAVGWGVLLAIIPALTACIVPALIAGHREPLRYIQGGRLAS